MTRICPFAAVALPLLGCTSPTSPGAGQAPEDSASPVAEELPEPYALEGLTVAADLDPQLDVVEVHLTAAVSSVEWVEGRQTEIWTYNGLVPGPVIAAKVGDTVRVVLTNELEEETTIHWHGLRISDEMDGVPAIQAPVQPGEQFTYEFVVPDSGTFWYHPHVRANEQIEHGLQGMLVVEEADAPELPERGFVLDDVYLSASGSFGSFNTNHMEQMHGRFGNLLLANGESRVLDGALAPGVPERWRIVNTANARMMSVEVDGAPWRIVAIDGTLLAEPLEVTRFRMPVGRRIDVEVLPQSSGDTVSLSVFTAGETYPVFEASVEGEPGPGEWTTWPATPLPALADPTQEVELVLNGRSSTSGQLEWTINDEVYGEHEALPVSADTPTRITVRDRSGADHPFHLHGQFFRVLSRDGEQLPWDAGRLDTVLVGGDEELVLQTDFDNPGRWMAHCHILEHAELGMMAELVIE